MLNCVLSIHDVIQNQVYAEAVEAVKVPWKP